MVKATDCNPVFFVGSIPIVDSKYSDKFGFNFYFMYHCTMRWDKEQEELLKSQMQEGKTLEELATLFSRTKKAIQMKMRKLGIKRDFTKLVSCLNCKCEFKTTTRRGGKFCSHSCAAIMTNKSREVILIMRDVSCLGCGKNLRLSDRAKRVRCDYCVSKLNGTMITKDKVCKTINCEEKPLGRCSYCEGCKYQYYKLYRPSCSFKFDVHIYPDRFDLSIVLRYGWYSPSNKGNNLKGVSRDHMFSVKDGFELGVAPDIISHPANCILMLHSDNSSKGRSSTITYNELLSRIKNF